MPTAWNSSGWVSPFWIVCAPPIESPAIARDTAPGSGNFCLLSDTPVAKWRAHLAAQGVEIIDSGLRDGATGTIDSLYFNDPDGNLVEVSNLVERR